MTAPTTTLPQPLAVRVLLEDLLGRDVEIKVIDAWAPQPVDRVAAAEFVDDQLSLRVVVLLDLPLAVWLGASVGLLPAGGAQDMVKEKLPSAMVLENLYEVLNVLTAAFNGVDAAHLRIERLHPPGSTFPVEVAAAVTRVAGRLDLATTVKGYGTGRLGLVLAG